MVLACKSSILKYSSEEESILFFILALSSIKACKVFIDLLLLSKFYLFPSNYSRQLEYSMGYVDLNDFGFD